MVKIEDSVTLLRKNNLEKPEKCKELSLDELLRENYELKEKYKKAHPGISDKRLNKIYGF